MSEVRGRGRPPRDGVARSSSVRNVERRVKLMAVVEAAEVWALAYQGKPHNDEAHLKWMAAQERLDAAVGVWLAYRKGQV